jgi:hypothetical protein
METTGHSTVVAVFDTRGQAESAIDKLWHEGFTQDRVGIVTPGGKTVEATTATEEIEEKAGQGAVTGALSGGTAGAVAGALVAGLVPGIGPVLAGGILTGIVVGGAAGAALGSYLGPFVALGLSEDEARHYGRHLQAGRTVVTVKAGPRAAEALTILRSHGGYNAEAPELAAVGPSS